MEYVKMNKMTDENIFSRIILTEGDSGSPWQQTEKRVNYIIHT